MAPRSFHATNNLTVILDLDGILIDASPSPRPYSDFFVTIQSQTGAAILSIYKRPYVDAFLAGLASFAYVFLFTTSSEEYAVQIGNRLDPLGQSFSGILTRKDCTQVGPATWRKESPAAEQT
jgi:TFIIF-interacting CTD phosphatase-like protein